MAELEEVGLYAAQSAVLRGCTKALLAVDCRLPVSPRRGDPSVLLFEDIVSEYCSRAVYEAELQQPLWTSKSAAGPRDDMYKAARCSSSY